MIKLFECIIPGRPMVKKNSKKLIRVRGKTIPIDSDAFREWEIGALPFVLQMRLAARIHEPLTHLLEMHIAFRLVNHHAEPDLSNLVEGPQDLLQKARVIANDRQIMIIHARKTFGEIVAPRTEISLFALDQTGGDGQNIGKGEK